MPSIKIIAKLNSVVCSNVEMCLISATQSSRGEDILLGGGVMQNRKRFDFQHEPIEKAMESAVNNT
jgi:hypothetical protein